MAAASVDTVAFTASAGPAPRHPRVTQLPCLRYVPASGVSDPYRPRLGPKAYVKAYLDVAVRTLSLIDYMEQHSPIGLEGAAVEVWHLTCRGKRGLHLNNHVGKVTMADETYEYGVIV